MADEAELFCTSASKTVVFARLLVSVNDLHRGLSSSVFRVEQITQNPCRAAARQGFFVGSVFIFSFLCRSDDDNDDRYGDDGNYTERRERRNEEHRKVLPKLRKAPPA